MFTIKPGDIIGLTAPSWLADPEEYGRIQSALQGLGFRTKEAALLYANGWGYAASAEERADSFHSLVRDDEVRMVFFGGGEGGDDVIPLLDYDLIAAHPKLYMSFSDGTSILNAIHFRTGLPVLYGQTPFDIEGAGEYNRANFQLHVVEGNVRRHLRAAPWHCVVPGQAEGILSAGYLDNYVYLANGGWIRPKPGERYILTLEEHRMFFPIEHVSDELARLENSPILRQSAGILFGQYDKEPEPYLLQRLKILGERKLLYKGRFHLPATNGSKPLKIKQLWLEGKPSRL